MPPRLEEMARPPALGRCPQCGVRLATTERRGVETQKCPDGHGFWVAPGGLDEIRKREHDAWFDRYVHMRW
jgi:Zn-finger nucleic acid-binding protein